ncbi:MAG: ribose 5-phosphate isomerase B [Clostridia bacterium]|nr:ribose 5-phosphate isomerase B [Clostridia bacterium]
MKISLACDHGGFEFKESIKGILTDKGYEVVDFGTYSLDSCDYPDFASKAAKAVANGECEKGIVICTTGIGVSIVANKVKGIRCALCTSVFQAEMTRKHNDTNVLAIGAGVTGPNLATKIVETWLDTEFEGGRHQRRVDKITDVESEEL